MISLSINGHNADICIRAFRPNQRAAIKIKRRAYRHLISEGPSLGGAKMMPWCASTSGSHEKGASSQRNRPNNWWLLREKRASSFVFPCSTMSDGDSDGVFFFYSHIDPFTYMSSKNRESQWSNRIEFERQRGESRYTLDCAVICLFTYLTCFKREIREFALAQLFFVFFFVFSKMNSVVSWTRRQLFGSLSRVPWTLFLCPFSPSSHIFVPFFLFDSCSPSFTLHPVRAMI